jgi:ribosomal protein S18 acetylase RimI-like enzyme
MWVSPAHRRARLAAGLVDAVVGWAGETGATTVDLWVTRGNDAAVRLYETQGFRMTGEHQPLPSDPCKDELRMRRVVDSAVRE